MGKKEASYGGTTPLYITKDPHGKNVIFTATDLVNGSGYLQSHNGKKFKPTKYKAHSISDIVTNSNFGKVKN